MLQGSQSEYCKIFISLHIITILLDHPSQKGVTGKRFELCRVGKSLEYF
jgi:hypothetical protein